MTFKTFTKLNTIFYNKMQDIFEIFSDFFNWRLAVCWLKRRFASRTGSLLAQAAVCFENRQFTGTSASPLAKPSNQNQTTKSINFLNACCPFSSLLKTPASSKTRAKTLPTSSCKIFVIFEAFTSE